MTLEVQALVPVFWGPEEVEGGCCRPRQRPGVSALEDSAADGRFSELALLGTTWLHLPGIILPQPRVPCLRTEL